MMRAAARIVSNEEIFRPVRISASSRLGQRQKFFLEHLDGRRRQQVGPAGGDHDGINDQRRAGGQSAEEFGDHFDIFRGEQHAGLHGRRWQLFKHGLDLLAQHFGRARLHGENAVGILRGEAGDGTGAVDTVGGKSFKIRLNAGAAAAVRAGDRERHRDGFLCGHGAG
jgi:hypothetical protein